MRQAAMVALIGAVLVAALLTGIGLPPRPVVASHFSASTATCAPVAAAAQLRCTLTIGPLVHPLPPGDVITVALAAGQFLDLPARSGGTCTTGPLAANAGSGYQMTVSSACDTGGTIVISELIAVTSTTRVCHTISDADVSSTQP